MAVGFGFSVGDLLAGIRVFKDSIEAFNDTKGATADFAALVGEISTLQDGLEAIEELQAENNFSSKQFAAIDRAISACQKSIDEFLVSIAKYQPHLHSQTSGWQSSYRKVKWALCKKEDVAHFRAHVARHASAINMLLVTFQIKQNMRISQAESTRTVTPGSQLALEDQFSGLLRNLSFEQRQCFLFLRHQNKELMQSVQDLGRMLKMQHAIPPQVLLQQPVVLLDCFGKKAPFHLEFVDSLDCFMAVLKVRFAQAGVKESGVAKLENHEFSIQETHRKRFLDLTKPWDTIFRPGQQVDMSMVFHRFACPPSTCPGCMETNQGESEQVDCQGCGLSYQSFQAIKCQCEACERQIPNTSETVFPYMLHQRRMGEGDTKFPAVELGSREDEIFRGYRRVQIIAQTMALLHTRYPSLQLIQDFRNFAELLEGVPVDTWRLLPSIMELRTTASQHLIRATSFPAFSTISQIEQARKRLTERTLSIRDRIDALMDAMFDDEDTWDIVEYMKQSKSKLAQEYLQPLTLSFPEHPTKRLVGYYTAMLIRRFHASSSKAVLKVEEKNAGNASYKSRSAEQVQWRMFDSRYPGAVRASGACKN